MLVAATALVESVHSSVLLVVLGAVGGCMVLLG